MLVSVRERDAQPIVCSLIYGKRWLPRKVSFCAEAVFLLRNLNTIGWIILSYYCLPLFFWIRKFKIVSVGVRLKCSVE